MDNVPQIFISATAADLESTRGAVKLAVLDAGCLTAEQKELPFDDRQIRGALKERIQNCDAVVALTGFVYGPEPNAKLSERRRSCAQMEHDLAIELQKPLFVFLFAYGYPFDKHNHVESDELRRLQESHRDQVVNSGRQYATVENEKELQLKLRDLAAFLTKVKASQDQRSASARYAIRAFAAAAVITLILLCGGGMFAWPYVQAYLNRPAPAVVPPVPAPPPAPVKIVAIRTPDEPHASPAMTPAPAPAPVAPVPAPVTPASVVASTPAPVPPTTPPMVAPSAPPPPVVVASTPAVQAMTPPPPATPPPVAAAPAPASPTPVPPVAASPAPAVVAAPAPVAPARPATPAPAADGPFTHVVEKGDTLWDIAQSYGTTIKRLQLFNKKLKPTNLKIGAEIRIPGPMEADPPSDGTETKEETAESKHKKGNQ